MISTLLAVWLAGANGKSITEVEVLERVNGVLKPVSDATIVMLRRAAPPPEGAAFVPLKRDPKRDGFYITDQIPAGTTEVYILIQKPSRDPRFKKYPAKDDPPGPIPYSRRIIREIQVNGHAAYEGPKRRNPVASRECLEPIVVCCCGVPTIVGYRLKQANPPDDDPGDATPATTDPPGVGQRENRNSGPRDEQVTQRLFNVVCPIDTVGKPEVASPASEVTSSKALGIRWTPLRCADPERIRSSFTDEVPARSLKIVRGDVGRSSP